jgi:hypothetical protein
MAAGHEMMSVGAYWRAANAYSEGPPNIQAFDAYRRSISAHIRQYGTLELDHLRRNVPLSRDERTSNVNPLVMMEAALVRCNNHHQETPGDTPQSRLQTNRQMASVYHDFALSLLTAGNIKEAGQFRVLQKDRQRLILMLERNYFPAFLYQIWRFTSNYGESLGRWAIACLSVILLFSFGYYELNVIESTVSSNGAPLHAFDYVYFSVITFTTLGYGDLHPIGLLGQALSCLEVFAGFIMFGVLLSFVGTRFQQG